MLQIRRNFTCGVLKILRRLDLAVETERRKGDEQVPKFLVEQISTRISAWLRISFAQFLSAESPPYLTPGSNVFVTKRQTPFGNVPDMRCGNKPSDGGNLILTDEEASELVKAEPGAKKFLRRFTA